MTLKHGSASPDVLQPRSSMTTGIGGDVSPRHDPGTAKPAANEELMSSARLASDEGKNRT